jgi:hypothetical protein
MIPGSYNLPDIRRGDTWPSRAIATITDSAGDPVEITAARLQIRDKKDDTQIYEWSTTGGTITLSGDTVDNVVTLDALSAVTTAGFEVGNKHNYDLEVTTGSGKTWTLLAGTVDIVEDVTR